MKKQNNFAKGIFFALITSVISGFAIFYSKISVAKMDPLILTTTRNLYVSIVFLLLVFFSKKLSELKKINRRDFLSLILIGIIGGGIPFYLFFSGLQLIGAQTGNLIHKTLFIWVVILGTIFLKEKLNRQYVISFLLIFAGTFFFAPFKFVFGKGEILVLSATFLWAVENIIAKITLKDVSSDRVGLFRMGIGSLVLLIMVLVTGKQHLLLSLNQAQFPVIVIGASILFFYVYFWYRSLQYAPVGLVTLLLTFSVVVGNFLNGGFAGVKLTQKDLLSSVFIGLGSLIIYFKILPRTVSHFIKKNG